MRWPWVLAVLVLAAPAGQAFSSIDHGHSPHDEVTGVAAEVGWPEDAVEALQQAVRQADVSDFDKEEVDGKERLVVTPVFHASHHCDRVPPGSDAGAFNATVAYIAWERDMAENLSLLDPTAAVRALGRALHALQDCYSHTNIVDLDPLAQGQLQASLLHGGPMPEGLRLCGSDPAVQEIGRPPGDPYAHDDHNKDAPDGSPESALLLPDGRTKHEAALAMATAATREFLLDFGTRLEPEETARLFEVEDDEGKKQAQGLPAPGVAWICAALVALVLLRRRCLP